MNNIAETAQQSKEKTCEGCRFLKLETWAKGRISYVCEMGWGEYAGRTVLTIQAEHKANAEPIRPKWCEEEAEG